MVEADCDATTTGPPEDDVVEEEDEEVLMERYEAKEQDDIARERGFRGESSVSGGS